MAKIVTIYSKKEVIDRALVNFVFSMASRNPGWHVERDGLAYALEIPGKDTKFSLVIKSADEETLIAGIPENNLFTIKVFDPQLYDAINEMLKLFESDKLVVIEI